MDTAVQIKDLANAVGNHIGLNGQHETLEQKTTRIRDAASSVVTTNIVPIMNSVGEVRDRLSRVETNQNHILEQVREVKGLLRGRGSAND